MTPFNPDMLRNPFPSYEMLRRGAPVFHFPPADMWMLFDYGNVKRALSDAESFGSEVTAGHDLGSEWLVFLDPPRHSKLRKLAVHAFTPRSIAALEPRVRALCTRLVDAAITAGSFDLVEAIAAPLPLLVVGEMLGIPGDEWPRLRRWSEAIIGLGNVVMGTPETAAAVRAAFVAADAEMDDYVARLVARRRAAPTDDLLSRLAHAEVDGERLDSREILGFVQLLIAAGTETTTNFIGNTILCFLDHPAELERLRAHPELLSSALEEVLRFRSPGQAAFRIARQDVEIGGHVIAAGKLVLPFVGSANRDPGIFVDPERFDIGRAPNPHLAFGHGIHACLGAVLSKLEARVLFAELFRRVKRFRLASSEPWPPRNVFHVHGPSRLPLTVEPAAPHEAAFDP